MNSTTRASQGKVDVVYSVIAKLTAMNKLKMDMSLLSVPVSVQKPVQHNIAIAKLSLSQLGDTTICGIAFEFCISSRQAVVVFPTKHIDIVRTVPVHVIGSPCAVHSQEHCNIKPLENLFEN